MALPTLYDDPGYSGGNMERPALKRLLADIAAKKIDVVVVYKVDRLTRALADFAKIVEIFDANAVSFVSITQAFNTTTSMGRLTLNVLLSFAQFEREVTGERIRDKIAASKKKGLWMGGQPALGYDVKDRKLVVNEAEAETVRAIFRRYLELGSVRELKAALDAEGVVSKRRTAANGERLWRPVLLARRALPDAAEPGLSRRDRPQGRRLSGRASGDRRRGSLAAGPGEARSQRRRADGRARQGEARLSARRRPVRRRGRSDDADARDQEGRALSLLRLAPADHGRQGERQREHMRREQGQRLPAGDLERLVIDRLKTFFADSDAIADLCRQRRRSAPNVKRALGAAAEIVQGHRSGGGGRDLRSPSTADRPRPGPSRSHRHRSCRGRVADALLGGGGSIADHLARDTTPIPKPPRPATDDDRRIRLTIAAELQRAGMEMRFVIDGVEIGAPPDAALVRLLTRAHSLARRLATNPSVTLEEAGAAEDMGAPYAARLMRLNFLAPDIVVAILNGRQPAALTATKLMADTRLPLAWTEQRKALGFA